MRSIKINGCHRYVIRSIALFDYQCQSLFQMIVPSRHKMYTLWLNLRRELCEHKYDSQTVRQLSWRSYFLLEDLIANMQVTVVLATLLAVASSVAATPAVTTSCPPCPPLPSAPPTDTVLPSPTVSTTTVTPTTTSISAGNLHKQRSPVTTTVIIPPYCPCPVWLWVSVRGIRCGNTYE